MNSVPGSARSVPQRSIGQTVGWRHGVAVVALGALGAIGSILLADAPARPVVAGTDADTPAARAVAAGEVATPATGSRSATRRIQPVRQTIVHHEVTVVRTPDLNGDGRVDEQDRELLLAAWGSADERFDLNGDGRVDGADLGILLGAWQP